MQSKLVKQHESDIARLQKEVANHNHASKLCLDKKSLRSNTTRSSDYKDTCRRLDVDGLDRILSIDAEQKIALCEPRVSMLQLAQETMKMGLIPLVVPEFKGITVGGAIMGCGGESSSHKYGLFHDSCKSFQLLLGDGKIVWASQDENRELFEAIGGSYGSLGVLLAAEVRLQKALPWVNLTVFRTNSPKDAIQKIRSLIGESDAPEFIEGIIFSQEEAVVITGLPSEHPNAAIFKDRPLSPWYYQQAKAERREMSMSLLDYLFRHDRGAFWMGAYVIQPAVLKRLFLEGIWKLKKPTPFTAAEQKQFTRRCNPGVIKRALSYPFTSSQRLYSVLHACEDWVAERFIIQDFTLPEHTVSDFLDKVMKSCNTFPLWLCPVKAMSGSQLFAPHMLGGANSINIGLYGVPGSTLGVFSALRELEQALAHFGGRKWLYTHSCYSVEDFWKVYPEAQYRELRNKYNANNMWMSIENKVLSK